MGDILTEGEHQREKERLLFALEVLGTESNIGRKITQRLIDILKLRNRTD